jgi:hypothetical protein
MSLIADFVNDADFQLGYHRFMCFVFYAGTNKPLQRRTWQKEAPDLCVASLTERDASIKGHFSKPEVQYVGSTAGCGCDFPNVNLHKGEWPFCELESDPKRDASDRYNRKALAALLQESGDVTVEHYGVWDGDFAETPRASEEISLQRILDSDFRFKERGFYRVNLKSGQPSTD